MVVKVKHDFVTFTPNIDIYEDVSGLIEYAITCYVVFVFAFPVVTDHLFI